MKRPGDYLLEYQRQWVRDDARWKFGLMARQVGKDYSSAAEGITDCIASEAGGHRKTWLIAAPSERQSLESLAKWKEWAEACRLTIADCREQRPGGSNGLLKSSSIIFPRGSRVIAVPGKPDTVRGYSANVLLTEFAFFEDADATWRAILPSITNPLRGGEKKVRLITTPNGIGNRAHDIWSKNYGRLGKWSCHLVDIWTAVKGGLQINVEELREAIEDGDCWAQEYECQFLDTQSVLLGYDLIATCESQDATASLPPEFWQSQAAAPVFMGIDFGRRRDLSVAWSMVPEGDVWRTIEVLEMERLSTPEQVERLRPRLQRAQRVCLDYTGPGIGDYLAREFGEFNGDAHKFGKIELCTFSNALKVELFSKLRMAFERRGLRVPVNRVIREDLHSVNRVTSAAGQITYRAAHSPDGHADRSTALALALRAAGSGHAPVAYARVGPGGPNGSARPGQGGRAKFL